MSITATFHFAWVDDSETSFVAGTHAREDEDVFSLEISQSEGEFASAHVEVTRPEDGLLNPARKQYAWISVTKDSTTTALFFGRVVGFPRDINEDVVSLEFIAQFPGWEDDRAALFATLKVLPFWDTAFMPANEIDNPDQALEARRALYHYDRLTGAITLSDIIVGTSTEAVSDHFHGSVSWDVTGNPAKRVKVTGRVEWEQRVIGESSRVNTKIRREFGGVVNTFTGVQFLRSWPRAGDGIGARSGYEVVKSDIRLIEPLPAAMPGESAAFRTKIDDGEQLFARAVFDAEQTTRDAKLRRYWFQTTLDIAYDFRQNRAETITATIENDVQALAFDADGGEIELDLTAENVVALGLFYPRYSSYFHTSRGQQSFHHLLARAQAALAASSRAVEITFERPFFDALGTSCKNGITLTDASLPGGTATGKIKSYRLAVDGESGETTAQITIAVCVGNGDTYASSGTDPSYVEDGYVEAGYQIVEGKTSSADIPAIIYESYGDQQPFNPPVIGHLVSDNLLESLTVTNGPAAQAALLAANQYPARDNVAGMIDANPTQLELTLRSLEPADDLEHTITVVIAHPFAAPMGIDLAA